MNIISFDIEEWYIEKHKYGGRPEKYAEYDKYLDKILEKLEQTGTKGTFFCVGGMAREFPEVIRKIDNAGHEIGCHSDEHTWLNKMTREQLEEDTHKAMDSLRQCIGKDVKSYRAPAFSVGKSNKWVFEVLYKNGVRKDSSIFPASRDFGGFPEFGMVEPAVVLSSDTMIKEFPICLTSVLGKQMAYSGGGYFRLFSYSFIKSKMEKSNYAISYFHINDLLPEKLGMKSKQEYEAYFKEKGTLLNRMKRYVKSNLGKAGALEKMSKLINNMGYVNIEQADKTIDWDKAKRIIL